MGRPDTPEIRHAYEHHHLAASRWHNFEVRDGDVIVSTSYKAGTTWMQTILGNIIFHETGMPGTINELSPWLAVVDACRFETVKKNPEKVTGDMSIGFKGGAATFINKGTNGRWKDVLTEAELQMYRDAMARILEPDCATWLENGGPY